MKNINFEHHFKNAEEILNNFINFKPVYVDGLMDSIKDTKIKLVSNDDQHVFKATRFATDMVLFTLKYVMPERYNVFNTTLNNGILVVSLKDLMKKVMRDMVDTYEYMFDDENTSEDKLMRLADGIRVSMIDGDDSLEDFVGMTEERFDRLKELVVKIHDMNCYTNTGELYSCLKDRRILNTNHEIDPGMLVFYSLFGENQNIWMNFSCEGHVVGKIEKGEPMFVLDEGFLMLDYHRQFNGKMGEIIESSVKYLLEANPTFNNYIKELDDENICFKYIMHPPVSDKGWDERVSLRFSGGAGVISKTSDVVGFKVSKIIYCLFEICKEINKRTIE